MQKSNQTAGSSGFQMNIALASRPSGAGPANGLEAEDPLEIAMVLAAGSGLSFGYGFIFGPETQAHRQESGNSPAKWHPYCLLYVLGQSVG
ncbi:uncharacterized protein N7511_008163 [Penicillium nucicola]|uniref:uncharacterized protein n=1 Tax=Penicillium nucicola TaxID=1850975 RepID=UPI002544EC13|nr:uncharacterized protein N7511_008163 [Penicillium nucicola]KAJ5754010.1 hypothetical protein N7511_008163 [Penicillium nucicola]